MKLVPSGDSSGTWWSGVCDLTGSQDHTPTLALMEKAKSQLNLYETRP